MSYQALYRKYRPTNFDEVVGQKHVIQTLKNAVVQERIAHAYLFCGPRGTGKTSIAKIFARMLNCTSTDEVRPCGHCDNCKMALNGSHPDIIEIDAASNNGVDEVRNLIDKVKYAPMEGVYKVYIIDEVHMMTTGAFNALLKTIEEPPEHVIFILATTEPNKVLPTIISRCQRFDFTRVSKKDIIRRLKIVCRDEQIEIEDEALDLIATLCDGGMRDALSILDQCVAYSNETIKSIDVRQIYGVITLEDIGKIFSHLMNHEIENVMSELQDINDQGMDLKRLTSDFISLLKDSVILDYSPETSLVDDESCEVINKYLIQTPLSIRIQLLDELMDTYNKYRFASNVLDYLESSLLKVVSTSYEKNVKIYDNPIKLAYEKPKIDENSNISNSHDLSDEKDMNIANTTENKEKQRETVSEIASDVSRETFSESEINENEFTLDIEFILSLLAGANKDYRKSDDEKYENLILYVSDPIFGKYASNIRRAKLMASGENYIVLNVESEIEAKKINELQLVDGFESFTNTLLDRPKKIFAIDALQKNIALDEFRKRLKNGTLPEPASIEIEYKENEIEEENNEEVELKGLFPNLEVIDD